MLAIQRMVVLEYKHRYLRRWLLLRFYKNRHCRLPGSDLRAAHLMSRIHRVARQHRNVIVLGRIEVNLAGIDHHLCGTRPANTVADVAYRAHMLPRAGIENRLALFAGNFANASLRHYWHVARVEVRTKDRRRPLTGSRRASCRQRIRLAIGIDVERQVFLNNPAIVLRIERCLRRSIKQCDLKIARRRENHVCHRRIALGSH